MTRPAHAPGGIPGTGGGTEPTGDEDDLRASEVELGALAVNVAVPATLQWSDTRRGAEFRLTSITVRLLSDGSLAAKAYGRPVTGGRGGYVSFAVPRTEALDDLIESAASAASERWAAHLGMA